ncbi:FxsB family radical SAM/SPASM domain protein [Nocardia sp. BSTN01]|uniref:FxsB family cyclophane-forming radical SAM/SPASM peptide maturase n=1 Tax=Nocardia sp. BSTN01 TaxID=2783665 RepID=UPI00188E9DD1|nr:FxsB family cyclophane-forming radical SAM/SPASM peptide maturase [Nocardia sp. BSTN01]MBF5001544.1 FxsB family radical SAM/SPASM domain protein [Nocardia sp. BSTN01]
MGSVSLSLSHFRERVLWPAVGLDVAELRRGGWEPLPFKEFIIKIHSRCNLACDYCYVYEMADQSWREQPKTMSRQVFDDACRMIGEHARVFGLPAVDLVLHGGEPLLVGHRDLEYFARRARELIEPIAEVRVGMQTNGVLLDEEFLRICDRWRIRIGVSIDGDEKANDRHRRDRRGSESYSRVADGLAKLTTSNWRHLFSGLLCTIDIDNDPAQTYEALTKFDPPAVDFLMPHGNWVTPPPASGIHDNTTPYADWLIKIFDRWYKAPVLETRVRLFDDIIDLLLGGDAVSETVGLAPVRLAVIETNGTLEQVDELKSTFAGATELSPTGVGNPLDLALQEPSIAARQIGAAALSDTCLSCPVHSVCGGGHYVHRYREATGFRNPSVYCADLKKLIEHIESAVSADLGLLDTYGA